MQSIKCPGSLMQAGHWVSCHTRCIVAHFSYCLIEVWVIRGCQTRQFSYLSSWTEKRGYFITCPLRLASVYVWKSHEKSKINEKFITNVIFKMQNQLIKCKLLFFKGKRNPNQYLSEYAMSCIHLTCLNTMYFPHHRSFHWKGKKGSSHKIFTRYS